MLTAVSLIWLSSDQQWYLEDRAAARSQTVNLDFSPTTPTMARRRGTVMSFNILRPVCIIYPVIVVLKETSRMSIHRTTTTILRIYPWMSITVKDLKSKLWCNQLKNLPNYDNFAQTFLLAIVSVAKERADWGWGRRWNILYKNQNKSHDGSPKITELLPAGWSWFYRSWLEN